MKNFIRSTSKQFNIKNTLIALACTLIFAQANAMEIDTEEKFPFLNLPDFVILNEILPNLSNNDIQATAHTCKRMANLVRSQTIQNLILIREIRSDIDQLIPEITTQTMQVYINQLNTILKNLNTINTVRRNSNNLRFAEEEREHLNQTLIRDYIEFYQSRDDINNNTLMSIIGAATRIDAHYAVLFHLDYIDKNAYTPFFSPTTMFAKAITYRSIKTLDVLLKNFPLYINQPINSREKTILNLAQEQLHYARKRDEAEKLNLQTIIEMLHANGAQTYAELDATQKKKRRASTPPPAPRKKR